MSADRSTAHDADAAATDRPKDFIRQIVAEDLERGTWDGRVATRFPPEPNGYLHLGHATAALLSQGVAQENGGEFHLRFDDTNPSREKQEFIDGIKADLGWIGIDWGEHEYYASDYFAQLYAWAEQLVTAGKAFVCDLSAEAMRETRGSLTEPGTDSPFRERSVEENLELLRGMRDGRDEEGSRTLRAKIDMAAPNVNLRDPVMYRILKVAHPRTGDRWSIYPSYDWAHGQSDSIERITYSLCSLEFEDHRPLYDWFIAQLGIFAPRQIEFARFNLTHAVMSKRKMRRLVEDGLVAGWDDPRMVTLAGMRRRGYPPEAIREFSADVGVSRRNKVIELSRLEYFTRQQLNSVAERRLAVLDPVEVVISNWPEGKVDWLDAVNNAGDPETGSRKIPFTGRLFIERDDFMEDPPRKFYRLSPGAEVRLRYAYLMTCEAVIKDEAGRIVQLRCRIDPDSRGGDAPDGRRVRGTIHWVSAEHALSAEVRLYDRLFTSEHPEDGGADFLAGINPESLNVLQGCKLEPSLGEIEPGQRVQFERLGYFTPDPDSAPDLPVFNRIVTLRDSWAKQQKSGA